MLWLLIGYMWLYVHRPFEVWPILGEMRLERIYALCAITATLLYPGKRWLPNSQHLAYFAFAAAVAVCWLMSPFMDYAQPKVEDYFKVLVFYLLIVVIVHDETSLRWVVLAFLGVMALYLLHSLREYVGGRYTYRMGIARMIGVDTALGDPNSFGAGIVYALPFVVPFWRCRPSPRLRLFLIGYVALSILCILLTGSRSSLVGLLVWLGLTVFRSRWRWPLAIGAAVALPVIWAALPASLQTRFETIVNPSVGPANAQTSATSRLEGLQIGLQLWADNPISGCGPYAWKPATGRTIESHNLYGQLLGEMGTLGLVTFLAILATFWMNIGRIQQAYREHPEWGQDFLWHLSRSIGMAVFLLLFEGNFGHNLFRYSWLWYGGFLIIARYCVEERLRRGWRPGWTIAAWRGRRAAALRGRRRAWTGTHA